MLVARAMEAAQQVGRSIRSGMDDNRIEQVRARPKELTEMTEGQLQAAIIQLGRLTVLAGLPRHQRLTGIRSHTSVGFPDLSHGPPRPGIVYAELKRREGKPRTA